MFDIKVPDHIENPAAYRAAVARKIAARQEQARRNKAGARLTEWTANPDNLALMQAMIAETAKPRPNQFVLRMLDSLTQWGSLTDKQDAAVRKVILDGESRARERAEAAASRAAVSRHVGKVGERRTFTVRLSSRFGFSGNMGWVVVHVFADEAGNELVWLTGEDLDCPAEGFFTVKATVKAHVERDGVMQTKVNRVVMTESAPDEAAFLAARFTTGSRKAIKL